MVSSKCEVCDAKLSKYKCPKCFLKYCSVSCYRSHKKNTCESRAENNLIEQTFAQKIAQQKDLSDRRSRKLATVAQLPYEDSEEDEEVDRVPPTKLEELEKNDTLKSLLQNPHLRKIVDQLDSSRSPAEDLEKAMHEPIFIEFAEECLKSVTTQPVVAGSQKDSCDT